MICVNKNVKTLLICTITQTLTLHYSKEGHLIGKQWRQRSFYWLGASINFIEQSKHKQGRESAQYCTDPSTKICNQDVSWILPPQSNR